MNKLRRYFNIPNKQQTSLIEKDILFVKELAEKENKKRWSDNYDLVLKLNSTCPACRKTDVVNKIAETKDNKYSTRTEPVNHCNSCGNQWVKYKITYKSDSDMISTYLSHIDDLFNEDPIYGADKTFDKLKHVHAESLHKLVQGPYTRSCEFLTLSNLRTKFKSVYCTDKPSL